MASRKSDLFISHASEDKDELVYPLATALAAAGLKLWYDEFSLQLGDNLRQSIDKGLAQARYGVIVLSKAFFRKQWPQWELDGLLQRQLDGKKVILPIWHRVEAADVKQYSLSLANLKGVTTDSGLGPVIDQILDVVMPDGAAMRRPSRAKSAFSATTDPVFEPVTRLSTPIRRIEPYYLEFAAALQSESDASVQSVLRKHPEMLFHISRGRGLLRTCFELGQPAFFDAVILSDMQIIVATLITLGPVSEPPFDASGTWSSDFATTVGRIAAARRWIGRNRDRFHRSLLKMVQAERGSDEYIKRLRWALDHGGSRLIRTHFLILAGRRAAINEHKRYTFHESFGATTLLSYDSILHSIVRTDFSFDLAKPVLVKELTIKPHQELKVSIKSWPLDDVLSSLDQSLNPLPAGATREISAIEVSFAGDVDPTPIKSSYAFKPNDVNKMSICVSEDGNRWTHPAHYSEWIYSQGRFAGSHTLSKAFRIVCKAPRLRSAQTLQFVIKSVRYKERWPELQAWDVADEDLL